jgi:hypothetical protein
MLYKINLDIIFKNDMMEKIWGEVASSRFSSDIYDYCEADDSELLMLMWMPVIMVNADKFNGRVNRRITKIPALNHCEGQTDYAHQVQWRS